MAQHLCREEVIGIRRNCRSPENMYIAARKDRSSKGLGTLGGGGAGSREDVKVLKIDLNLMGKVEEGSWKGRLTRGRRGKAGGRGRQPTRTDSSRSSAEFSFIPKGIEPPSTKQLEIQTTWD